MPALLPRRKRSRLGGRLSPSAGPGGPGDPWSGPSCVLLRHRLQADPARPVGGPEAEAAGGQDHDRLGSVLLHLLAPLRSGNLRGRAAASGGPAPVLQAGGGFGRVAVCGGAHGVRALLPKPAALRVSGGRVQELGPQGPDSESGLQFEDFTPETQRDFNDTRDGILQFTFQLRSLRAALCSVHIM